MVRFWPMKQAPEKEHIKLWRDPGLPQPLWNPALPIRATLRAISKASSASLRVDSAILYKTAIVSPDTIGKIVLSSRFCRFPGSHWARFRYRNRGRIESHIVGNQNCSDSFLKPAPIPIPTPTPTCTAVRGRPRPRLPGVVDYRRFKRWRPMSTAIRIRKRSD